MERSKRRRIAGLIAGNERSRNHPKVCDGPMVDVTHSRPDLAQGIFQHRCNPETLMTIRHITIHIEPRSDEVDTGPLALALSLARGQGAAITALAFPTDVEASVDAMTDSITALKGRATHMAAAAAVPLTLAERSSHAYGTGEVFADHLRVSDLGLARADRSSSPLMRMFLWTAIFEGGCPLVLVPPGVEEVPRRLVIGWDASAAAARAVRAALPLAAMGTQMIVAAVSEAADDRLDQSGVALAHHIARHGGKATFRAVQGSRKEASAALLALADSADADGLVIGAVRHSPLREMLLGSVTADLLRAPPQRLVLMSA
jgi:nucleotide-binding universal stress UspA family protein